MKINHNYFLNLAFNLAKINLGKTNSNPSVGCVIVKNGSVISSGYTSKNGRPHAEANALNKKMNFNGSEIYVTMEPCIHQGLTSPCTNIIAKKGIKQVYYSFNDVDDRTANKSYLVLLKKKIKSIKIENNKFKNFYQSYIKNKKKNLPLVDAKIALSKDNFTINKKKSWITNSHSRSRVHLIRSEYDSIISTATSINKDNSLLNCRIKGFDNNKPNLIIVDLKLKLKTNLNLFDLNKRRKIFIVTSIRDNKKKTFLKKKGVNFITINALKEKKNFIDLLRILKNKGFNRILSETGLKFLKELVKFKLISNLYIFKSSKKLKKNGSNNISSQFLKEIKLLKKITVNLYGDTLYKKKY